MMTEAATATEDPIARYVSGQDFRMLIGGELVAAAGGAVAPTLDPSTGEHLRDVPEAQPEDVGRAIAAAQRAQPGWEALGIEGRSACFARFGELLIENLEELAMLDAIDAGNPVEAMRMDVRICMAYIEGWPALARALNGQVIPASAGNLHYTSFSPYGVVGRITAFNHPLMFSATRPLPALIAGNTVVMKPAPQAPLSTLRLGELLAEAFPAGVVNVITGGAAAGDALVSDRRLKRLAFTGSVATGLLIQRRAAESGGVKHVSLELGGKNAMVVMPDADLDEVVEGAIYGMNFTVCQGQSCGSNSRVLVHRSLYDDFVAATAERLRSIRVGLAYEDETNMGPLISAAHHERVTGFVASGREQGATLVCGGGRPEDVPAGGFFLEPTLFGDVRPEMDIAREEIFGPVMSALPWDDYGRMLEVANGVELGLTASVWTDDLHLAHRTAERLEAGYVWINDSTRHYFGTPFGGQKNSGTGREESIDELLSYLEPKVVHTRLRDAEAALARHLT